MSTETQSATSSAEHGLNGSSPAATAAGKKPKKRGAASASSGTKTKTKRKAKASASSRKPTKKSAKKKAAAGKAKIAKGATYALVARLGKEVYDKAWKKVEKLAKAQKDGEPRISMSSWLVSVIARAAK